MPDTLQILLDNQTDTLLEEYESWEDAYDRIGHEVALSSLAGRRVA